MKQKLQQNCTRYQEAVLSVVSAGLEIYEQKRESVWEGLRFATSAGNEEDTTLQELAVSRFWGLS